MNLHEDELDRLLHARHDDPHHVLGIHPSDAGWVVRTSQPGAAAVKVVLENGSVDAVPFRADGLFSAEIPGDPQGVPPRYTLETVDGEGRVTRAGDPYRFPPTLGALDLHLFGEGRHRRLWEALGAHALTVDGETGTRFSVWAPSARRVSVVGDFNAWDGRRHMMRRVGASGVWEIFLPGVSEGHHYKFELVWPDGSVHLKLDPMARRCELRPRTAALVEGPSRWAWTDTAWMDARARREPLASPMSVYEVHLGSWMRVPEEGNRWLTYRELAPRLAEHVLRLGFTHVELMPVAEHPFDGSWGYQVTGYFAPTSRFGTPDDFRAFVDTLHAHGIGVILDWVPAHFPRDAFALARFDGTALYEHADPRQGEHPDWGTLVFNFGRHEVRNFLLANALYWLHEFHVDGLRVDAVASMLYLDYSRGHGQWVPNRHGGRENLEAIAFLRELNEVVHAEHPGAFVAAEESTSWPAVSRPTYVGGLGFTFKWNMGWMHDTLEYLSMDPLFRSFHHDKLTFGLMYAYSENFVLPLSHDEVVHLKRSLIGKMPGDRWQRFANLRLLYGFMWAHPGKKLLFMGSEFAQEREWNHDVSLDWHLRADPMHEGVLRWLSDLNAFYRTHAAMWARDTAPDGFQWSVVGDRGQSVAAFARFDRADGACVLCVINATPVVRHGYRIGVPRPGRWVEALNSDAAMYGGSNVGNGGGRETEPVASHGFDHSLVLTVPPLGVLWFEAPEPPMVLDLEPATDAPISDQIAARTPSMQPPPAPVVEPR